ncbi:Protein of unknown function [Leuconostoc citreum LBAE C10]|nr:Protein of unknown function [Leuconostoc citreum LBAE C10]
MHFSVDRILQLRYTVNEESDEHTDY